VNNVNGGIIRASELESVSCTAGTAGGPDTCVAVGYVQGPNDALVETWNGSTWSVSVGPGSDTLIDGQLDSVSCAAPTQCMAVGGFDNGGMALELNDGTWSLSATPDPAGNSGDSMLSVSCPQVNDCVAFWWTTFVTSGNALERAITWNGSTWSGAKTLVAGGAPEIQWLTCATTSSCVAVGFKEPGRAERTLVKVVNGNGWRTTPSRSPTKQSSMAEVSCASSSFCVAVGTEIFGGGDPFIESGPA
jgi:hypothetical protein